MGVTSTATVGPKPHPPLKFQLVAAPSSMTATSFSSLSAVCANALPAKHKSKAAIVMVPVACAIRIEILAQRDFVLCDLTLGHLSCALRFETARSCGLPQVLRR